MGRRDRAKERLDEQERWAALVLTLEICLSALCRGCGVWPPYAARPGSGCSVARDGSAGGLVTARARKVGKRVDSVSLPKASREAAARAGTRL
jgi:hypothetical protein